MTDELTLFDIPEVTPVWPDQPRYLMSFAYRDDSLVQVCVDRGIDLIVDSGAFTVASLGKVMDHEGYLQWVKDWKHAISFALSLDVIGDHEASAVNHQHALDVVGDDVQMVPTFHLGSPLGELERLCDVYPFVSIGGAVPFAKQPVHLAMVMRQIHRIAAEHDVKLHGLGMTGGRIVYGNPWYSVDSSSWTIPTRFPSLPLTTRDGKMTSLEHGYKLDGVERQLIRDYDGDPDVVATKGWSLKKEVGADVAIERREWVMKASARAFMYAEAYKNGMMPETPIKLYLSGNTGGVEGGAPGVIHRAWSMGSPYPTATPNPTQEGTS